MHSSQTPSSYGRSSGYKEAALNVVKAPRWRSLFLTFLLLVVACWTWRASQENIPLARLPTSLNRIVKGHHDQHHDDDDLVARPPTLTLSNVTIDLESGDSKTVPSRLKKANPQFHLLVHAPKINAGVCRCLLSSYILDYPPPTLIGYQPDVDSPVSYQNYTMNSNNETTATEKDQNGIPDVSDYLRNQQRIKDDDAVLMVDGENTLFQLPSEALLSSFAVESKHHNSHLATEYPPISLHSRNGFQKYQRFNQSVFFASIRKTGSTTSTQSGRRLLNLNLFGRPTKHSVAQQSSADEEETSINDATILGTGASIRRLFYAASTANKQVIRPDASTFRTMYAQQSRVRAGIFDSPRHRRGIWHVWRLWLLAKFSVDHAVRYEQDKEARTAAVRDLGIGLDEASKLVYTIPEEENSSSGLGYGFVGKVKDSKLEIPEVLKSRQGVRGPFNMHPSHLHENLTLPDPSISSRHRRTTEDHDDHDDDAQEINEEEDWVRREDPLPPSTTDWSSIPLIHDPNSPSIPPIISTSSDEVYEKLWFHPYARTLLNQYLLRSLSKEVASEAAVGGERWWDSRGGRGGVWTANGEWLDAGELCADYGGDLFVDGEDYWEEEMEEDEKQKPVVVQWVNVPVVQPSGDQGSVNNNDAVAGTDQQHEGEEQPQYDEQSQQQQQQQQQTGGDQSSQQEQEEETWQQESAEPQNEREGGEEGGETEEGIDDHYINNEPVTETKPFEHEEKTQEPKSEEEEQKDDGAEKSKDESQNKDMNQGERNEKQQEPNTNTDTDMDKDKDIDIPLAIMPDGSVKALSEFGDGSKDTTASSFSPL